MSDSLLRVLLDSSLRAFAVAGIVAVMLIALRVHTAAVRHAAWTAVLCAMLLMPILPDCVPAIAIPVSGRALRMSTSLGAETSSQAFFAAPVVERPRRAQVAEAVPSMPPPPVPDAARKHGTVWPTAALIAYGIGTLILLLRLWAGWRDADRLIRMGRRIARPEGRRALGLWPGNPPICESELVAVPVTVGIARPTVMLPVGWRLWSNEKLRGVLAHELAHVRRRDPVVGFLAHINRCIFWFHPLAWWLERKLAVAAEHACDAAAVRELGQAQPYAETLLDMAELVRRKAGRLAWRSVGIDGSGLLHNRIDRVLGGDLFLELSPIRKTLVAAACATAIFVAAACRQPAAPPPALREDPRMAERQARQQAELDLARTARDMSPQGVADLESKLQENPQDLLALKRLLIFYWATGSGNGPPVAEKVKAIRRAHILGLIEHHPDSDLAGSVEARLFPIGGDSLADPVGYAQARRLWLTHANRPGANGVVLGNAANFFEAADKPLAEEMLLRAQIRDPQGPWSGRLGKFYAVVLVGSYVPTSAERSLRDVSFAEPHGPYPEVIRRKLTESTDVELLTAAAQSLVRSPRGSAWPDFDPDLLARSYLERALRLNPQSIRAHTELVDLRSRERTRRIYELILRKIPPASQSEAASTLPEADRFDLLPDLALTACAQFEDTARNEDSNLQGYADLARERSRRFAEDLLELAPRFQTDPRYGTAIYKANMVLGSLALKAGERKAAVRYMRRASAAPVSEELEYASWIPALSLPRDLLEAGERESVVEFLEHMAEINVAGRAYLRDSAAAIRRGQMPRFDYWAMTHLWPG
jgi:beta-lactamase regulating signal transducer with metallopeptidase domain